MAAPANDNFADRIALTGSTFSASGTTVDSTIEDDEVTSYNDYGVGSVWYEWTAPSDGALQITVDNATFEGEWDIYSGDTILTLDYEAYDGFDVGDSGVDTIDVQEGATYKIGVYNYEAPGGTFDISGVFSPLIAVYHAWTGYTDEGSTTTNGEIIAYTEESRRENLGTQMIYKNGGEVEVRAKRLGNYNISVYVSLDKGDYSLLGTMNVSSNLITFPVTFPVLFGEGSIASKKFHIDPLERWKDARIKLVQSDTTDDLTILETSIIAFKEEYENEITR